jgi:hypothetical protein
MGGKVVCMYVVVKIWGKKNQKKNQKKKNHIIKY